MSTVKKVFLIIGVLFMISGIAMITVSVALSGDKIKIPFDLNLKLVSKTYTADKDFSRIEINTVSADVTFFVTDRDTSYIEYTENSKMNINAEIKDGCLKVKQKNALKWYNNIGFTTEKEYINIYLKKYDLESLDIISVSGDIEIPETVKFKNVQLSTVSGDINMLCGIDGSLNAHTTSGDIECENAVCRKIKFSTVSGDIECKRSDAEEIKISTTSGDVNLDILTKKTFKASSVSGEIKLPDTSSGGVCSINTVSGDIDVKINLR